MFIKSRLAINILVLHCFMSISASVAAQEVVDPQKYIPKKYIPRQLSKTQKMLVLIQRYHMGNNPKILAGLVALIPAITLASTVESWLIAAPVVSAGLGAIELPTLSGEVDTTSQPEEFESLISRDMPVDNSHDLIRPAGFFTAGAATMSAVLWYIFGH